MTKRIISLVLAAFMLATVCLSLSSCGGAEENDSIVGKWHWASIEKPFVEFYEDNTGIIRYQGSEFSDMTWEYREDTVVISIAEYEDLHQKFDTILIKQMRCKSGCLFGVLDDSQDSFLLEVFDSVSTGEKFNKAAQEHFDLLEELYNRTYKNDNEAYKSFIDCYMKKILPLMD